MNAQISFRKLFFSFLFITATLVSTSAFANNDEKTTGKNELTVNLKFIGKIENSPVFQLDILNKGTEKEFIINIVDEYGNTLYKSALKTNAGSKKFMLNADEISLDNTIRFEIIGRTSNKKITYEVNNTSRVINETSVVAVK
ncbi:MAG: hypothetical protein QM687_15050 [Ferruginibacter sp.]